MRIRWREDVGWEMRCDDCVHYGHTSTYWPLEPAGEFWDKRSHKRCVACERTRVNRRRREARALRPRPTDGRTTERSRRYYWENADRERAQARDYYYRNREAILEKRRERYYATKEEAA